MFYLLDVPHGLWEVAGRRSAVFILTAFAVGMGASPTVAQTISSGTNQIFNVGSPDRLANPILITDAAGTINTVTGIRIIIPNNLNLQWSDTVGTLAVSGSAAGKISTTPTYSANGDTLTIAVTADWTAGDLLIIGNLVFTNFTAMNNSQRLRLAAGAVTNAQDNFTITIEAVLVTIESNSDQTFVVGDTATPISQIRITEADLITQIKANNDLRVRIPAGFNMIWDPTITTAMVTGPDANKVSSSVTYANGGQVLVIDVLSDFAANDRITVSGLRFANFTAPSAPGRLELVTDPVTDLTIAFDVHTKTIIPKIYGVSLSPHATAASRLPSNGANYTVAFTVTDTSNGTSTVSYDLLTSHRPGGGGVLTTVSITGTGVTQGADPDSARVTLPSGGAAVATVTYSVGNVTAGSIDTLVLTVRSVESPATSDTGKLAVTVTRPSVTVVRSVNPAGTPPPGADLTYTLTLTNAGTENAVNVVHIDSLPAEIGFQVGSVTTTLPAGVTGTVAYSSDGGTTWTYVPVSGGCGAPAGYDYCVRDIRLSLDNPLSHLGPNNIVQLVFVAQVK